PIVWPASWWVLSIIDSRTSTSVLEADGSTALLHHLVTHTSSYFPPTLAGGMVTTIPMMMTACSTISARARPTIWRCPETTLLSGIIGHLERGCWSLGY